MQYKLDTSSLESNATNPSNTNYDILVTGTSNLTYTLRAPAFASQGLFDGVDAKQSLPEILDSEGRQATPGKNDTLLLQVDQLTGYTL